MYRPLWSETILREVGIVLKEKLGYTESQSKHRIVRMKEAFPEALVHFEEPFSSSLEGIPDAKDRHVLAAAICGHANAIVTQNVRHFPQDYLQQFSILCHNADDFLIHQFCLRPEQVLEKLDAQASGINKTRADVIAKLAVVVPNFISRVQTWE